MILLRLMYSNDNIELYVIILHYAYIALIQIFPIQVEGKWKFDSLSIIYMFYSRYVSYVKDILPTYLTYFIYAIRPKRE